MKCFFFALSLCACMSAASNAWASAQNLLAGGGFEPVGGEVPGWNLEEFATGSGTLLNTAELVGFMPDSGASELWLRAFAGDDVPGPDNLTNAILTQTVPGVAGESYTFTGSSRWEVNYSGGYDILGVGPLGTAPSPTSTTMKLEFLSAANAILGSPITLDLRSEQSNSNAWKSHSLNGIAPEGTARVRVTAEARDMVYNVGPMQSAFYDNFSLTRASVPATELLANADLEVLSPTGLESWSVVQNDPENPTNTEIVRTEGFANRPESGGIKGVWLSAFFGEPGAEVDGIISQTVPGAPGLTYTFSGWSRWEANYSGAAASPTHTFMELLFLDASDNVLGSPVELDLRTEQLPDDVWREHALTGVAPAGTVSVRVRAGMLDGTRDFFSITDQSAFFDDFALVAVPEPVSAAFLVISICCLTQSRELHIGGSSRQNAIRIRFEDAAMNFAVGFVHDGPDRHEVAIDVQIEQVRAEVEAEFAEQLASATWWEWVKLRRNIRTEIARRVPKRSSLYNLYGKSI